MEEVTLKPYEEAKHLAIDLLLEDIHRYINENLKEENRIARIDGNILSRALTELTGFYESLSEWLAHQRLKINDMQTALDIAFAGHYVKYKQAGDTNEVAKMRCKIDFGDDEQAINQEKHLFDVVEAVRKTVGRYHDSARSQLSYEKQQESFNRGTGL